MSSEKKLFKFICDYYDKKGISYEIDEKEYDILVINKDRELPVNFFVSAQTNPLSIRICGYMPFKVPSKSQEMTIMALQAINQRLSMGHFLMYTSSGTVDIV